MAFPSLICELSSFITSKTCGFIFYQCIVLYLTLVISCPPGKLKDEPYPGTIKPTDDGESTNPDEPTSRELVTDSASDRVIVDSKIVQFNVQPEMPNNTEHAWVMICKEGSMKFDKCCISNQLWYLEQMPKQKRMYR